MKELPYHLTCLSPGFSFPLQIAIQASQIQVVHWVLKLLTKKTTTKYRGYYMAAPRYEISLQVFKNVKNFSTLEEKFCISKRPLFYFITQTPMKYRTISLLINSFAVKGVIYYVAIARVIFHVWRYHVFARKLTW